MNIIRTRVNFKNNINFVKLPYFILMILYLHFPFFRYMMEQLGEPQTHVALKQMIAEVDEDFDGNISYREVNKF